jgi:dolichol-phosphate mannosyltransferase
MLLSTLLKNERKKAMATLVITPTYNERENIGPFIDAVRSTCPEADILIVDDNSPDKTAEVVQSKMATDKKVHLLSRPGKQGLGRAYLAGFKWAIDHDFDVMAQMDADFSHRTIDLKNILANASKGDFLVGSRWVPGGGTENWTFFRKLVSRGGSIYARWILGFPLRDWTGGFNCWHKNVLEGMDYQSVQSNGYSFQIEMKFRALQKGFKVVEVPIWFEDRKAGVSKMSAKILFEALYRVWRFRFQSKA